MRISFSAVAHTPLCLPAYAVADGDDAASTVARAIARANRGRPTNPVSTGRNGGRVVYRTTVIRGTGEIIGAVDYVVAQ